MAFTGARVAGWAAAACVTHTAPRPSFERRNRHAPPHPPRNPWASAPQAWGFLFPLVHRRLPLAPQCCTPPPPPSWAATSARRRPAAASQRSGATSTASTCAACSPSAPSLQRCDTQLLRSLVTREPRCAVRGRYWPFEEPVAQRPRRDGDVDAVVLQGKLHHACRTLRVFLAHA